MKKITIFEGKTAGDQGSYKIVFPGGVPTKKIMIWIKGSDIVESDSFEFLTSVGLDYGNGGEVVKGFSNSTPTVENPVINVGLRDGADELGACNMIRVAWNIPENQTGAFEGYIVFNG